MGACQTHVLDKAGMTQAASDICAEIEALDYDLYETTTVS